VSVLPYILIPVPGKIEKLPLSVTHPELAQEADGWDPDIIYAGSDKKLPWKCSLGHRYSAIVGNRTRVKSGCPYCSGKQALPGFNDLLTVAPEIAKQAYGWDPTQITAGSGKKLDWICTDGHIWNAQVSSRRRAGCPYCAGQKLIVGRNDLLTLNPTVAKELQHYKPNAIFAHSNIKYEWQCELGHLWKAAAADRMSGQGCPICAGKIIQIGFNDLQSQSPEIARELIGFNPTKTTISSGKKLKWRCSQGHIWIASVASRTRGSGCPYCSNQTVLAGFNDLLTTNSEIGSQAHGWDPTKVIAGSNKKREWKCDFDHIYSTAPSSRIRGDNCPFCSNHKVLRGFNDLATKFPGIAVEADGWNPQEILAGSHAKVNWICSAGHSWSAQVKSRTIENGSNCPSCAVSGFDPNSDGWLYLLAHPKWKMLKIGITNFPKDRLGSHKKLGWDLLEIRGPMDGLIAREWERSILKMLKAKGADLSNSKIAGKFDGYSEAWSKSTFEVKSIKELMKLTEEFEDDSKD